MKLKTKFEFDDMVTTVADNTVVMLISKIGKNDDNSISYFGKRVIKDGEPYDNEEIGPFTEEDLVKYKEK